ncbi:MAG: type IX secretion system membrane protein PorP/SprF, partial [Bacteroidota bacterium]
GSSSPMRRWKKPGRFRTRRRSVLQSQLDGTPTLDDPLLTSSGNTTGGGNRDNADLSTSYFDINFGVLYKTRDPKAGTSLELGLAAAHIGSPNDEFGSGGQSSGGGGQNPNQNDDAVRPMTITAHGTYITPITEKITAEPSFLFQTASGSGNNIILQAVGGYQLTEQIKLQGGFGYRFGDAGQILAGAVIDERLRLGLAYDLNFSELSSVTSNQGGFEIAANYIFNIYKKPEIKPTILCPQF